MKTFRIPVNVIFILLLVSFNKAGIPKIKFNIEAEIAGLKNDSVFLFISKQNPKDLSVKTDTFSTVALNGKFSIKGETSEVTNAYVILDKRGRKNFSLFVENGHILVSGSIDSLDKLRITGTPENEIYTAAMHQEFVFYDSVAVLSNQLKLLTDKNGSQARAINADMERLRDSVKQFWITFTESHPDALTSGIFLYVLQDRVPLATLERLWNGVSERVKKGRYGPGIQATIDAKKRTAIGNMAPEFTVNDIAGNKISLTGYRGRYVLLDFWASWCVPCRAENPALKEAYHKYKDRGFTIISVSVDTDNDKWKEAIAKDSLPWTHVCQGYDVHGIAKLYGVQPIPDNFLINPEGKIVARELRGTEVDKSLSQLIK